LAWGLQRAKPLFFGQSAKLFGQKPVAKNEQKYLLNEKTEFIPSSNMIHEVPEIRDFINRILGIG